MSYEIVEAKNAEEAVSKAKIKVGELVLVNQVRASANSNNTYSVAVERVSPLPESPWKHPCVPRHAVQMLVYDRNEKVILMHRSNNVRSARNVWSIPTGLHDIGETIRQTIRRELHEECQLETKSHTLLGQYENIAGDADADKQFHWVLSIYAVEVEDVTKMVNVEPEKHDELKFISIDEMLRVEEFLTNYQFHGSFQNHAKDWPRTYGRQLLSLARSEEDLYYA